MIERSEKNEKIEAILEAYEWMREMFVEMNELTLLPHDVPEDYLITKTEKKT